MTALDSWRALATERPGMAIYPEMIARPPVAAADSLPYPAEGYGHPHGSARLSGYVGRECARDWCKRCDDPACDCPHHEEDLAEALTTLLLWARSTAARRENREIRKFARLDPVRQRIRAMHSRYPSRWRSRRG
jgi:hypothetical protein